ncbi:MAG: YchJ family protein [Desulfobacteraceae bacterium]|nr:MAG: YchJ family protein [Desulfobacteraceae bacterium]
MEPCPCGSSQTYSECCEPFIQGLNQPTTAEALMRSRYSAFVKEQIDYIYNTMPPAKRRDFNRAETEAWSKNSEWQGLEILQTKDGGTGDEAGTVEFIARFLDKGNPVEHHEVAEFEKIDGQWFFMDGRAPKPAPVIRQGPKTGRNDPCPCGSGKKFKKCCGA